jgi:iron complex outermembrane recepter protein
LPPSDVQKPYKPETVKTYEMGGKADYLDHHLRTNISIYQSDYKDLQETQIASLPVTPFYGEYINNAAQAKVRGVELETITVPIDALTISFSATYLDAKYENYVVSLIPGQPAQNYSYFPFPFASKFTFKVAPQYVYSLGSYGELAANLDWTYSTTYTTTSVPYPLSYVHPMGLLNASLKYSDPSDKYYVKIYGENLTNKHWLEGYTNTPTAPGGASIYSVGQDSKPLTWGVSVGARF